MHDKHDQAVCGACAKAKAPMGPDTHRVYTQEPFAIFARPLYISDAQQEVIERLARFWNLKCAKGPCAYIYIYIYLL